MKILYFSPFSYIRDFAFPEASTIKTLIEKGHDVTRIACNKTFSSYCTSMKSISLDPNSDDSIKKKICDQCILNSKSISNIKGLNTIKTSDLISKKQKANISDYINSLSIENFDFNSFYGSVNLNKIAFYEVILRFKINNVLKLDKDQFKYFKNELKNCYISWTIGENFKKISQNDVLLIFSPQYGILNAFYNGYKNTQLTTYLIEGSNNNYYKNNILRCYNWDINKLVNPAKKNWSFFKNQKLYHDKKALAIVNRHINLMYKAKSQFVYSKKKSTIRFSRPYELKSYKKTALLNMSSNDESFAAHVIGAFPDEKVFSTIFNNQIDWIDYTIDFFKKTPEYCLIIRVHPREIANKREKVISQHWIQLKQRFDRNDLPKNIIVNWPQDNISFYDLINDVDILIANSSITVVEALYHNVPVVTYDNTLTNYPDEMVYSGNSKFDYEKNIIRAFNEKKSNLRKVALNWLIYTHYTSNIKLNSTIINSKLFRAIRKIIMMIQIKELINLLNKIELKFSNLEDDSKEIFNNVISNKFDSVLELKKKSIEI